MLEHLQQEWYKYLLEILVITIGILGAFALNNWNENRKTRDEEQILYQQLKLDYEANLAQLNEKISLHKIIIDAGNSLLRSYDDPQNANLDSVMADLSVLGIDPTFDPIINDLSSSGKINLVRNPELNRLLSNWSSDIVSLIELEQVWSDVDYSLFEDRKNQLEINRDVNSFFWENYNVNNQWILGQKSPTKHQITRSNRAIDLTAILTDYNLEGIISFGILANQAALSQAEALRERIVRILSLIRNEIKE